MTAPDDEGSQAQLAAARAGFFGLLARVFGSRPTVQLIQGMREPQMLEALEAFGVTLGTDIEPGGEEEQVRALAVEYTRLFVGPGPHIAAYESVYVSGEDGARRQLWGQAATEVAGFYGELGLELPPGQMPDHLSLELQAMAVMAQSQADMLVAGDEDGAALVAGMQEKFCREHLSRWVPEVCREVERETGSDFYRGMAALAAGLIEMVCGSDGQVT
ncbi:MAG: TorD/DmsD family molecular chaperone [Thermoleophilia bacterium]